jgi:hypothetical protein
MRLSRIQFLLAGWEQILVSRRYRGLSTLVLKAVPRVHGRRHTEVQCLQAHQWYIGASKARKRISHCERPRTPAMLKCGNQIFGLVALGRDLNLTCGCHFRFAFTGDSHRSGASSSLVANSGSVRPCPCLLKFFITLGSSVREVDNKEWIGLGSHDEYECCLFCPTNGENMKPKYLDPDPLSATLASYQR